MGSPPVKGFGQGDPALQRWAEETFEPEDAVLAEIRARSAARGCPRSPSVAWTGSTSR